MYVVNKLECFLCIRSKNTISISLIDYVFI